MLRKCKFTLIVVTMLLSLSTVIAVAAEPTTLTVWTRVAEENAKMFFETFDALNPDIRLEVEYIPGGKNHINKLVASVAAGSTPDVTTLDVIATNQFVDLEALMPLESWISSDAQFSLDSFPVGPLKTGQVDGVQYAIPFGGDASAIAYNRDLFSERGLDPDNPPHTWDQFTEAARQLTFDRTGNGTNDVYGFLFVPSQPWLTTFFWLPYFWMAGGEFFDEDANTYGLNSEAGVEAMDFLMDLHLKEGVILPSAIGAASTVDNLLDFIQGRVAMAFAGPGVVRRVERDVPDFNLGIMQHPSPSMDVPNMSFSGGDNVAIMSSIPDEKLPAAKRLVEFLVSLEGQRLWWESLYFLPVRKELLDDPYYDDHPLDRAYLQAFMNSHEPPVTSHYVEIQQYLRDAFEEVAFGISSSEAALDKVVRRAQTLMDRTGRP